MRHCVSEDDGLTWRMLPNAIPVTCVMPLTTVIRCTDGSYLGMYNDRWPERKKMWNRVFQIRSTDGGFTWSAPGELVAQSEKMNLCEPFLLRSDDGKELCAILRDNCRGALSKLVFSRDEGNTWTAPADSAPALSGHRHAGVKDSAGRWTIVFRDFEPKSPFGHDYCAWRGTYADIVARRPGEKIKEELLMNEEGLQKTSNKLIFIGKQIEIDEKNFAFRLNALRNAALENNEKVAVDALHDMVPTFTTPDAFNSKELKKEIMEKAVESA
jgi:hypothetical protein